MKRKNRQTLMLIVGILLLFVVIMLIYFNYNRLNDSKPESGSPDTETPVEKPKEAKPTKPAERPSSKPDVNEVDSVHVDSEPEPGEADTLKTEGTEQGTEIEEAVSESTFLYIPHTKSIFNATIESPQALPTSKTYHQSSRGRIESMVLSNSNGEMIEYLTSYDKAGNKIDNLEIGLISNEGKPIKYAVLFQDKVLTYTLSHNKNNKAQELVTEYGITNDLRFVKGKTYTKL